MKKRMFKWTAVGVFLLSFGIILFRATPEDSFRPEYVSVSAALETSVQQSLPGVEVEATVVQEADDKAVLVSGGIERETMLSTGEVERRRLITRSGKYPNRLVVETYVRSTVLQQYEAVSCSEMVADQVLVRLRETATEEDLVRLAEAHDAAVVRALSDGKTFVVRLSGPGLDAVDDAVSAFSRASAAVAYAEPDYIRHLSVTPNDPMVGSLWGMAKISMPDAWSLSTGSRSAVVAVLDTGVDMDHSDLAANLWTNSGEIAGDGVDNDGNGLIDDVNGWDFLGDDNNPDDADGHGTHCAGTIGAVGNNGTLVAGVCWTVSIMPVRIGTEAGLADSDIADGIRYAARSGAKVLSNSYGGTGFSQTAYDAIAYAYQRGCIFVAAAGNEGVNNDAIPQYPADYDLPNIISVAATDENDALADFSNYGATSVDLAAPGVNIVSTYPGGGTETLQGTSMACPHVAGALGLLVSENAEITPEEAKQILLDSVDPVDALAGKLVSGGRLNVFTLFSGASDLDQDGMPDSWEELNGLDPNDPLDALLDPDGDFLTNLQEFKNACDPNNPDSDGDSLVDGWEVHYGFNPGNVQGALPKLQYLGFNEFCQDARDVALANGYAYVADGQYGLKVLDLNDPEAPVGVGSYSTGGSARGVSVVGSRVYLSDAEKGLLILDVSNPASPQLVASLETSAYKTDVQGNYAYVAAYTNGLKIASIADPANPQWVGQLLRIGMEAFDVKVAGTKAYVGIDGAVIVANVAAPSKPSIEAKHISALDAVSVESVGKDLLVAYNSYGVMAYNASLKPIGEFQTPGDAQDVCYDGGLIYVADGSKGLQILDGSDLTDINLYSAYSYVSAYAVAVSKGYVYVAGKESGLQIFRSSPDADEDGLSDAWEMEYFGSLAQLPTDDFDADGINNWGEYLALLSPIHADQDHDGLVDGTDEVQTYNTDPRTDDTDGDGLFDGFEVNTNGVDNLYLTDPLKADSDDDGMPDSWELDNGLNPLVNDAAGDADSDGADNLTEYTAGTDPANSDSDSDSMPDGWEIDHGLNPLEDDASLDADGDTLSNAQEYAAGTDPLEVDTDQDGLTDADELNVYNTNPTASDSDGDGMPDGWEVENGLDPTVDDSSIDTDGDTLSNQLEYLNGSNPSNADTDGDGFSDLDEWNFGTDATNPADPIFVDDDHADDPQASDPLISNPDENGTIDAPFDSIQEAIDAAVGGSTVLVMNGYYIGSGNLNINPKGKAVSIIAYSSNPLDTVIDADGLGAAFLFQSGETTNTLVKGFAITSPPGDCSDGACGYEYGLVCKDGSSPYIQNCYIYNCAYDGIFCSFASSPLIENVEIASCGGGVSAGSGSVPRIMNSFIHSVGSGISVSDGDGLMVSGTTVSNCSGRGISVVNSAGSIISNCVVVGNLGGFSFEATSSTLLDTLITNNVAPDYYTFSGVQYKSRENIALLAANTEETEDVTNLDENGGGILLSSGSTLTLKNCVLGANRAVALDPAYPDSLPAFGLGGALYIGADCYTTNINCTYADNEARRGGGISSHGTHADFIRNSILWGNTAEDLWIGEQTLRVTTIEGGVTNVADVTTNVLMRATQNTYASLQCRNGAFDVWYSDVEHGGTYVKPSKYVIELNPLFTPIYTLSMGSPCIDSGTFMSAPLTDVVGTERPQDGNLDLVPMVDMGAYEFVHPFFAELDVNGLSSPDNDLDGISNLDEWIAGSDANDSNSIFKVSIAPLTSNSGVRVSFNSVFDRLYTIYRAEELNGPWTVWQADLPADGNLLSIIDTSALPHSFYKVAVRPLQVTDEDHDGLSSYDEYLIGSDPLNPDSDGDGLLDGYDEVQTYHTSPVKVDTDGDGLDDRFEVSTNDFDNVYITNPLRADSDGDGMPDSWELDHGFNPLVDDSAEDADADGATNLEEFDAGTDPRDADSDNDGIEDGWELDQGFDPLDNSDAAEDADGDSLTNEQEYTAGTNPNSVDSDSDGMPDNWEVAHGLNPLVDDAEDDADSDGLTNLDEFSAGTDLQSADSDSDGMPDGWEQDQGFDPLDDSDGAEDADSDSLTNAQEYAAGTNPFEADTDSDGMPDNWEVAHGLNPLVDDAANDADADGVTNLDEYTAGTDPQSADSDNDGMPDGWEFDQGFDPLDNSDGTEDADNDSLTNAQEFDAGTNPFEADSDSDGMPDSWEVAHSLSPLVDDAADDADSDGVTNLDEYTAGTDPQSPDSDSDGMPDDWELAHSLNAVVDDSADDADSDGATNLAEYTAGTDPQNADSDADELNDGDELNVYSTNPLVPDTDSDGMPDGWEVRFGLLPLVNDAALDRDEDGFTNLFEYQHGMDPTKADSDNDGVSDQQEVAWGTDPANPADPLFVDDDHAADPQPSDPQVSAPGENGSLNAPFDAIQEAIDAATDGTTILVADGLYIGAGNLNINPHGKKLTVRATGAATINAQGLGAAFVFDSGENRDTMIQGFTLTSPPGDCTDDTCGYEYGIVCSNDSSPSILDCTISNCALDAISCTFSSPLVSNAVITACRSGILGTLGSAPTIVDSVIYGLSGSGIDMTDSSGLSVSGTTISNVTDRGVSVVGDSDCAFTNCVVVNNLGGFYFEASRPVLSSCVISNNVSSSLVQKNGAGILLADQSVLTAVNTLIVENETDGLGGGLYIGAGSSSTNMNCTLANNSAQSGGGVAVDGTAGDTQSTFGVLRNTIIWGNNADDSQYASLLCRNGSFDVWYSDIQNGGTYVSADNYVIDGDPLFSPGYLLGMDSPCIDQGTSFNAPTSDLVGTARPLDGNGDLLAKVDLGVFEYLLITADSDGDGLSDSFETSTNLVDNVYLTDPTKEDTDGDGLSDSAEIYTHATNPLKADSDEDGLRDDAELNLHGTDPMDPDSDNDGLSDYAEVIDHNTDPRSDDTDGDTLPDLWEVQNGLDPLSDDTALDPDADGADNLAEYTADTDPQDSDTDDDTLPDGWEITNGTDPLTADAVADPDDDGLTNREEYDLGTDPQTAHSDGDTLTDAEECALGTNPLEADSDSDGLDDAFEVSTNATDNLYITDPLDADTDGDTLSDHFEVTTNATDNLYFTDPTSTDTDADGLSDDAEINTHHTDPTKVDTDADTLPDQWEVLNGLDPLNDDTAADPDADGADNLAEYIASTDPQDSDTDNDGMPDGWELDHSTDPLTDDAAEDPDSDGLTNLEEFNQTTDPQDADSDDDMLSDGAEVNTHGTDPLAADTDGEGLNDGFEVTTNGVDNLYITDPLLVDTDGDTLSDLFEITTNATDNLYFTDPTSADTDGDTLPDAWEVQHGLDPLSDDTLADPDADGLNNLGEYTAGTDPQNADSDADTMPDGWEVANGLDPLSDDTLADPDTDGLNNLAEYNAGTDPQDADSDDDGLSDGEEVNTYSTDPLDADSDDDTLSDGAEVNTHGTNPLSTDTDSDGMPDAWEVSYGLAATVADPTLDSDADGLTNLQEYNLGSDPTETDSDNDGIADDTEVSWGTDPANAADPLFVDDDHAADPQPSDPQVSAPGENGSLNAPFDAIQEAIDAATNGTTILVAEGLYIGAGNLNINPHGKKLTVRATGAATINAQGLGAAFVFDSGENRDTMIQGFTLTSPPGDCTDDTCGYEYGIVCSNDSSPSILDCTISNCALDAISCTFSSPLVSNAVITACRSGILGTLGSAPTIVDSVIYGLSGSGIDMTDSSGLSVSGTTISNVTDRGVSVVGDSDCAFTNCVVVNNLGGFYFEASRPVLSSCVISNNVSSSLVQKNGAGILLADQSVLTAVNTLIVENETDGLGGGLYIGAGCSSTNINCTLAGNVAQSGGGVAVDGTAGATQSTFGVLRNTIIWGNISADSKYASLLCRNGSLDVWYSDIQNGGTYVSAGNYVFDLDPLFSPGYVLGVDSPCIDQGTSFNAPTSDLVGNARPLDGNGDLVAKVDLGVFEYLLITADTDGDGLLDAFETSTNLVDNVYLTDPTRADTDGDTLSDYAEIYTHATHPLKADSDEDGLRDDAEIITHGTDPMDADSDDDGLNDYAEVIDHNTNPLSGDTDGDTLPDLWEVQNGLDPLSDDTALDPDADGADNLAEYTAGTDPQDSDTDDDTLPDGWEIANGTDPLIADAGADPDADGLTNREEYDLGTDPLTAHSDGDTLTDAEEHALGTNPLAADSDSDGLDDAFEISTNATDNLYFTDPLLSDTDGDSLSDQFEITTNATDNLYFTDPTSTDTDADGLSDDAEINTHHTDPTKVDTDADTLPDQWEVLNGLDPLNDDTAADPDADGADNLAEYIASTDPQDSDTDNDGMPDGWELDHSTDPLTDDAAEDPDSDGLTNLEEFNQTTDPQDADSDDDTLSDGAEVNTHGTEPLSADTDGEGLNDGFEVTTNGVDNLYITDPLLVDTDGDTLSDLFEITTNATDNLYFTDPTSADTDADTLPDAWEVQHGLDPLSDDTLADPDADGLNNLGEYTAGTDPQNADSDADTMPDGWEVANGLDPLSDDTLADPDTDGLNNLAEYNAGTDPQDDDSDDDGLNDGFEVTTNGVDNLYVTDPLDADSDDDTLSDGAEVNTHGTNPLSSDTDSDGMPDAWEVFYGLAATVADPTLDSDADGLTNLQEYNLGSNPNETDSDDDGFEDQDEAAFGTDPANAADPLFVDDDHAADPQPYDPLTSNPLEDGSINAPFDSIQEAIDAAVDGSTVLVTNGYYIGSGNRNIDPLGKAISIITFSSNPMDTIIDADGLGSAFLFQNGEDTNTVVRGFEIVSPAGGCADGECGYEYGIVCMDGSSPYIQDCFIHECKMAGIYCSFVSSPIIENVRIGDCAIGIEADSGSSPTLINCLVYGISGTGILVSDAEELVVSDTTIINCAERGVEIVNVDESRFTNCVVTDNLGGFRFEASRAVIESSQIIGNVAPEYYMYEGAVRATNTLMADVADADPDYSDVTSDDENGGGILLLDGSVLTLINCVLAENRAVALDPGFDPSDSSSLPNFGLGGALYVGSGCRSFSINCTFAGNEARRGAAISSDGTDANYIRNAILWGNVAEDQWISGGALSTAAQNQYASLECRAGSFDIWYSDVEYGDSYINPRKYVIEADPLFVLGGYELSAGSPCIDVGTSNEAPETDVLGTERPLDGDGNGTLVVDLGAYEFEP